MKEFFQANGAAIIVGFTVLIFGLSFIRFWEKKEKKNKTTVKSGKLINLPKNIDDYIILDEHEDKMS